MPFSLYGGDGIRFKSFILLEDPFREGGDESPKDLNNLYSVA